MSLPVLTISCNTCDFRSSGTRTWGVREYVLTNGTRIEAEWNLGWCDDCKNVAPVELLDLEYAKNQVLESKAHLNSLGQRPVRNRLSLKDIFGRSFQKRVEDWEFYANKLADAEDYLALLTSRTSPAKCFNCGSEHVTTPLITDGKAPKRNDLSVPIGFIHPVCGGELMAGYDGFRIALVPMVYRYTPEGIKIDSDSVPGYTSPDYEFYEDRDTHNARIRGFTMAKRHTFPETDIQFNPKGN